MASATNITRLNAVLGTNIYRFAYTPFLGDGYSILYSG